MITVTKQENGVLFTFENSDKYLYGSGTIEVPFNSLSIIQDESNMITLRKSASNDIFLAARYDTDLGYSSKEEAVEALKGMLFAETGGGSGSGMTPSEVQEMIDESVSGKADTATVNQIANEAAQAILSVSGDVQTNASNIADIYNTIDEKEEVIASALTEVRQDVADIDAKEEVIASALTEVNLALDNKLDVTAYTPTDLSQYWTSAQTQSAIDEAKAYFIDLDAIMSRGGLTDADWDGAIAAVNAHRPVYIKFYNGHYILESYNLYDNTMYLSASDGEAASQFTIIKNGSNDYSLNRAIRGFVSDAQTEAWNAKQDALSAGTGIEISGNVISATGGGGATYSAGYGINIDTANTISFNMPITCTTNINDNITIGNGTNNGMWSLLVGNDMNITNSSAAIGLCVNDMSIGGSSISGNARGVLIGCQNTIKGGNISVGGGVAIGDRNESTNGGIVIGTASKASGSSTVAIGLSANATGTTKMNLNNQIKVDANNQVYIKDKDNVNEVCIQDAIAALGGLKLVKLSQSEYDNLPTKDPNTLYIVSNVVS